MSDLILIVGMAALTFGIRFVMFAVSGRLRFPDFLDRALRFVPPAVLAALILPAVLMPDGTELRLSLSSPELAGAVAALLVGHLSGKLLAVILSGIATFWLWRYLGGLGVFPF